ncbi:unnamed protein product, partial [Hymenolepis diminuta]
DCSYPPSKRDNSASISTCSNVEIKTTLSSNNDLRNRITRGSSPLETDPLCPKKCEVESASFGFSSHLSYAEKLLLEKSRRNELFSYRQMEKKADCNSSIGQEENKEDEGILVEQDIDMLHRLS